ncbi:hypothetical protein [Streptomyces scopuliridis]|uniref:hypothetical protein n=1 Tax=Streptomyces scopuliridis TaxID=452529 RepID=UPI0034475304
MARRDRNSGVRGATWCRCEWPACGRIWSRPPTTGPVPAFCSDACKQACWRHRSGLRQRFAADLRAFDQVRAARRRWWREVGARRAERQAHWRAKEARWRRQEQRWAREDAEWRAWQQQFNARRTPPGRTSIPRARERVFELAGLDDDTTLSLRTAWRAAAQRHHPDRGGTTAAMQELVDLKELLDTQTDWRA